MNSVVYFNPHNKDCFAVKLAKQGDAPTLWNLRHVNLVQCDEKGNISDAAHLGVTHAWFELKCGDPDCNAIKRINAVAVANTD